MEKVLNKHPKAFKTRESQRRGSIHSRGAYNKCPVYGVVEMIVLEELFIEENAHVSS